MICLFTHNVYKKKCLHRSDMCWSILHLSKQKCLSPVMIYDLQTAAKARMQMKAMLTLIYKVLPRTDCNYRGGRGRGKKNCPDASGRCVRMYVYQN